MGTNQVILPNHSNEVKGLTKLESQYSSEALRSIYDTLYDMNLTQDSKKRADDQKMQNLAQQKQQENDERYRIIVEQTGAIVIEWNRDRNEFYLAPAVEETFPGHYEGRDIFEVWKEEQVVHPKYMLAVENFIKQSRGNSSLTEMVIQLKTRRRGYVWYKVSMSSVRDKENRIKRIIATLHDVDEAVNSEKALKYRAEFDTLTDIYNMDGFCSASRKLLNKNPSQAYAVIRMDLSRFKLINDIYGREEGDKLLQYIAQSLEAEIRHVGTYGRVSGDVFCAMVCFETQEKLIPLIKRLAERVALYSLGYRVTPSFGICVVDDRSIPVSILCDWANLALKTVKGNLIQQWAFYDDRLRARQLEERMIEEETERALASGQFTVYLQPKHNIGSHKVVGAEALVRWNHPKEGLMMPDRFIPLFEKNGFVIRLDEYVWEETCKIIRRWIDNGWEPMPVSMNVSRAHVYNPDFGRKLIAMAEKYRIPHHLIELELTESTFIENTAELYEEMKMLQRQLFTFSMDDFGSGYSSLNMLKNAPIDSIKLDREFLNETTATLRGQTVIQCTVAMARLLNLAVIAEGVETEKQADFLLNAGCSIAQGYFFSRPMPADEFEKLAFYTTGGTDVRK